MKRYILLPVLLIALSACNKWTDVSPKTSIDDERFFDNEQGFREALNGVYLLMGNPGLYGRELTFGMSDVLGGMYVLDASNGSLAYRQLQAGLYENAGPQALIVKAWEKSYNAIANVNKLLEELEKADTSMFDQNNYNIIKGEALGLRAFLHFDMLRLFGKSIAAGGGGEKSIPYVRSYSTGINPRLTSNEVLANIREDLEQAAVLLKSDPLLTGESTSGTTNDLLLNRKLRFNYFAAKALLARAELWAGNRPAALLAAEEVIGAAGRVFPWVLQSAVVATETQRDRTFTTEHIFGLYVNDLAENYANLLDSSQYTSTLIIGAARIAEQFETASVGTGDYRQVYLIRETSRLGQNKIFFGKLYQPAGMPSNLARRIPLIRIPEMYYIAAECLSDSNPQQSMEYLTTVRNARGITTPYPNGLSGDQLRNEIRKEYWKEFPLEGQMFYYYKRTNSTTVPGITGNFNTQNYVLPLPPNEIEFGE